MNKQNKEFINIVKDIISNDIIQSLRLYKHHYGSNRYEHCLSVAYYSYKICKFLGLDHVSAARAGLLHDLFYMIVKIRKPDPKIILKNIQK